MDYGRYVGVIKNNKMVAISETRFFDSHILAYSHMFTSKVP